MYLSETAGYIPVTSLRNRPAAAVVPPYGADLDGWRSESWDRDYSHRLRYNNTRVQRKFKLIRQVGCRMDVCQGYLVMVVSVRLFLQPLIYIASIMTINLYKKKTSKIC